MPHSTIAILVTGSPKAETWEASRAVVDTLEAALKDLSITNNGSRLKGKLLEKLMANSLYQSKGISVVLLQILTGRISGGAAR